MLAKYKSLILHYAEDTFSAMQNDVPTVDGAGAVLEPQTGDRVDTRRRPGRPHRSADGRSMVNLCVRMTAGERALLDERAAASGFASVSDYVRGRVLGDATAHATGAEAA